MSDEPTGVPTQSPSGARSRREVQVRVAIGVGLACAVVATVLGMAMALRRRDDPCPDGKVFPEGTTDFRCFTHPQGLEGGAVALVSVMLGILIVLVGMLLISTYAREERDTG